MENRKDKTRGFAVKFAALTFLISFTLLLAGGLSQPAQAAGIFNTMTDNLALVGKILWAMDAASRGKILGAMNADTAAQVTRIMEPR